MMKTKRIHLTLPEDIIELIDEEAKKRFMDRSNFIRMVVTHKVMEAQHIGTSGDSSLGVALETATGKRIEIEKRNTVPSGEIHVIDEEKFSTKNSEEDIFASLPVIGVCRYCKARKEVNTVVYADPSDGEEITYQICEADMKKLESHQRNHGGTILTVNGKSYE